MFFCWQHRAAELIYTKVVTRLFNSAVRRRPKNMDAVKEEFNRRISFFKSIVRESGSCLTDSKFIHVSGTKGKGSTCEYIAAALRGHGYKVGVFTSPHLHTTCERIKIGRELISHKDFVRLGQWALERTSEENWVNFFDILLTMALRYFSEKNVDYVILETGIGGRLDSTNFVDSPRACVITSVSYDHQNLLGNSLKEIAWHKAGIVKKESEVFTTSNLHPDAMEVLQRECEVKQAALHVVDISARSEKGSFGVEIENRTLASAVCAHLKVPLDGMEDYFWPCRMETFNVQSPGSRCCDARHTVVLDGSHNGLSVKLCMQGLRAHYSADEWHLWVLIGTGRDKNVDNMLQEILETADRVMPVQARHYRALSEMDMLAKVPEPYQHKLMLPCKHETLAKAGDGGTVGKRLLTALERARLHTSGELALKSGNKNKSIVIAVCGSLFAAAEAREALLEIDSNLFTDDDWVRFMDPDIVMHSSKSSL